MPNSVKSLSFDQLRKNCDCQEFDFKTTEELPVLEGIIAQDRALHALSFGINVHDHGYHIYALGPIGTGKATTIRKFLLKDAENKPTPDDWIYVNNFDDNDKPIAISLPAGKGKIFKEDMDNVVSELKSEAPKAFESKEYEQKQEEIEKEFQHKTKDFLQVMEAQALKQNFKLIQTMQGISAIPLVNGEVITPEQLSAIPQKEQDELEAKQEEVLSKIRESMREINLLQKQKKDRLNEVDRNFIGYLINHFLDELKEKYNKCAAVLKFLQNVQAHLLKNIQAFKQLAIAQTLAGQQRMPMQMPGAANKKENSFDEYRVNLIVDNSQTKGAPVIVEKNPTGQNLVGRVEHQEWFGTLVTNFSMIKPGSLHKANGGYLIIDALDLLQKPLSWHIIKRALKNEEVVIESIAEALGALVARTLQPAPVPLNTKVILIGDQFIYDLLFRYDQEFKELFKIKADFETHMVRSIETNKQYAQFISTVCREEKLQHFAPSGVAKVIEFGARLVDHKNKLSTRFSDVVDLIRQANYWAKQNSSKLVKAEDVEKALEEKIYRSNRLEKHVQELIHEGIILIDVVGSVVGQINGLSVLQLGDYSFGQPSRITAATYVGTKGIINIDREAELTGPIHNKGALIIIGYLGHKYANDVPLAFSASITFEQSYNGVEGDSASSTEIYALLSSLSECPIRQEIAVTGSVNQRGEIQPIGGVNEKVEGFFAVCKAKGLTGTQGVIIPIQNVEHLMLKQEVVTAVKDGKFHIYPVKTIDEGIEILTNVPGGVKEADGSFTKNSLNDKVQQKIIALAQKAKDFAKINNSSSNKKL